MKFNLFNREKRIHLDYAATTPVHKDVMMHMRPFWSDKWANPSAVYKEGVEARQVIENAREKLAQTLRVRSSGITFTSGGTESNNLALYGVLRSLVKEGKKFSDFEIITTRAEHPSIQEVVNHLSEYGVVVKYAPLDDDGVIDIDVFETLISPKTALVSFAYVNSETGVIQDVKKISRIVRKSNEEHDGLTLVHIDACQASLWLPCALDSLGVDLMSLDSGKCYGPKGAGVLAHVHGTNISPIMLGGEQEDGLRAGTENAALVVGCTEAIVRAQESHVSRSEDTTSIRDYGFELFLKEIPDAIVNGSRMSRVANNINISIPGLDTEYAVIVLDKEGVAASTKSACGASKKTGSSVVMEMTKDESRANSTIRFTLGEESKKSDLRYACSVLKKHVEYMKNAL